jgi:hypothetical protein
MALIIDPIAIAEKAALVASREVAARDRRETQG